MSARHSTPSPLAARQSGKLAGRIKVPGDKSLSHRALMFGALAVGETRVTGLLEGEDILATAAVLRQLGATVTHEADGIWSIHGVGVGGLAEPDDILDFGNSGTSARLMMGLLATHPITAIATGDASLRRRPMGRVLTPLRSFGATTAGRSGDRLPLALTGAPSPLPIRYTLPVASAQVKSAILLAGLNTPGTTTVIEPEPTRDHTERFLKGFGAALRVTETPEGRVIEVDGHAELTPQRLEIPGDPSSAAFPVVAALLCPRSEVRVENVLTNSTRTGLYTTLREMGADIVFENERLLAGEPVADLVVRASSLSAVEVPPERAPSMIDEYPVLFVAATFAEGRSVFRGLQELRVKESDRLGAMARGLTLCGAKVEELPDGLVVEGTGGLLGGATVATEMDHRIAMAFLVGGLAAAKPITVDDTAMIATSFPTFVSLMRGLGAEFV